MCVDTHKFRCCCGCMSLTSATILIGVLYLLSAIGSAVVQNWWGFAFEICLVGIFSLVLCKPHSEGTRKLIYYVVAIIMALGAIAFIIFVIYAFASDWEVTVCRDFGGEIEGFFDSP